jgi:hypothetical protein
LARKVVGKRARVPAWYLPCTIYSRNVSEGLGKTYRMVPNKGEMSRARELDFNKEDVDYKNHGRDSA